MSKVRKTLIAGVVAVATLIGPGSTLPMAVRAAGTIDDISQLRENTEDEIFKVMRLDPSAGMLRLSLTIPEGRTLKRIVVARPGEDKYRLIKDLDAAAAKILDGEAEGLILNEVQNPLVLGQTFDNWVGFAIYDYIETGVRFLERNPADVMYVGVVIGDVATDDEARYYYKLDYRSCAHQQAIIEGEIIMCEIRHEDGKLIFVPEASKITDEVPTWEGELLELAKNVVAEYFDSLEAVEAMRVEGKKIERGQIEALEDGQEKMDVMLAKFPKMREISALSDDYATRVAALKLVVEASREPSDGATEVVRPSEVVGVVDKALGTIGEGVVENNAVGAPTGVTTVVAAEKDIMPRIDEGEKKMEGAKASSGEEAEKRAEIAVPNLGGESTWLERYGVALLLAGAVATGVAGWFTIGMFAKKRKHKER